METIKDIVDRNGGIEWLPEKSPLLISIDPENHFTIEYIGFSPHDLPAVSVSFFRNDQGPEWHRRVLFEITDLGWLPYHLFSRPEVLVVNVYTFTNGGRIERTDLSARSQLISFVQRMDEELEVLLSPDEIVLT